MQIDLRCLSTGCLKHLGVACVASLCLFGAPTAWPQGVKAALQERPFSPTDRTLFSPAAYPDAPPLEPARGGGLTEGQALSRLSAYLAEGLPHAPGKVQQGIALFSDARLLAKIPNPTLRAGLIGLLGTIGEPTIDYVLNATTPAGLSKVSVIGFDDLPWDPSDTGSARSILASNDQQAWVFNPKYTAEDPFLFSFLHAHEALHSDPQVATSEEVVNLLVGSIVYLQQLAAHPDLATKGTELARRSNTNALALLNSGTGSRLGLFASNGNTQILPGSPVPAKNWFEQFNQVSGFIDTPGNALLAADLNRALRPQGRSCSTSQFSVALLRCLDPYLRPLTSRQLLAAAASLRLVIPASSYGRDRRGDVNEDDDGETHGRRHGNYPR